MGCSDSSWPTPASSVSSGAGSAPFLVPSVRVGATRTSEGPSPVPRGTRAEARRSPRFLGSPSLTCPALRPRRILRARPLSPSADAFRITDGVGSANSYEAQSHGPPAPCVRFTASVTLTVQRSVPAGGHPVVWDSHPPGCFEVFRCLRHVIFVPPSLVLAHQCSVSRWQFDIMQRVSRRRSTRRWRDRTAARLAQGHHWAGWLGRGAGQGQGARGGCIAC